MNHTRTHGYLAGRQQTLEDERHDPLAHVLFHKLAIFRVNLHAEFAILSVRYLRRRLAILGVTKTRSQIASQGV